MLRIVESSRHERKTTMSEREKPKTRLKITRISHLKVSTFHHKHTSNSNQATQQTLEESLTEGSQDGQNSTATHQGTRKVKS